MMTQLLTIHVQASHQLIRVSDERGAFLSQMKKEKKLKNKKKKNVIKESSRLFGNDL